MQELVAHDTIVAIATPPGRGGLGIVRLSGPEARGIVLPLLRLRNPLAAGHARFAELLDPESLSNIAGPTMLDEAMVTYFQAPHSYTGDDVVELSLHGSPVLLHAVIRFALTQGARLAEPGEFTQRAFLSGRLDLTRAEAVRDLIDSTTLHQARVAAAQLGGSISRAIAPAKRALLTLIATLEAGIDFAEDDLDTFPTAEIPAAIAPIAESLRALLATAAHGRMLREGLTIALVGQPNAGKSSMFNRLLGRDRSIVTGTPGTTRDTVSEPFSVKGIPVQLVDTAGLRGMSAVVEIDEAESAGIARTLTTLAEADQILLVVDAEKLVATGLEFNAEEAEVLLASGGRPVVVVMNKADLLGEERRAGLTLEFPEAVLLSSVTGEGVQDLLMRLESVLTGTAPSVDTALITSLRQQRSLETALASLESAGRSAKGGIPHEMILLDLYGGLDGVDELTGATEHEDILKEIFSTFCIGK
jgi:tRNA modification GTPase